MSSDKSAPYCLPPRPASRFGRRAGLFFAAALTAALAFPSAAAGAEEDDTTRGTRLNGYIESLNASSDRRAKVVDTIYSELKGQYSREMQDLLRESLRRPNSLILLGVIEAMAMYGDPRDVPFMESAIATVTSVEVKTLGIRLLPSFCLGSERDRFNYIRYAAGYAPQATPQILAPLRRPPLSRRGRLDPTLDGLRLRIVATLSSLCDPVGVALGYVDDLSTQASARAAVTFYTGNALGNDPSRWREIWAALGAGIPYRNAADVEEIRVTLLQSLADMGAEGRPAVIDALGRTSDGPASALTQMAFETMATLCRAAYAQARNIAGMTFDPADLSAVDIWRARRRESAVNLALFVSDRGTKILAGGADAADFNVAAAALGAALAIPPDYPDPDGRLAAARNKGVDFFERLAMQPDLDWEKRAAVVRATGEIGMTRGAEAILGVLRSPYVSPESGAGGLRLADAAIESLVRIATGDQEGLATARAALMELLSDGREFPSTRPGGPPVGMRHLVLWRLQRLAKSTETSLDAGFWRPRLGW